MGGITDAIGGIFGSDDGADAARDASQLQAQYQREALDYLKEREALPRQYREGALNVLGGLFGLGAPTSGGPAQQTTSGQMMERPTLNLQEVPEVASGLPAGDQGSLDNARRRNEAANRRRQQIIAENDAARRAYDEQMAAYEAQQAQQAQMQNAASGMSPQEQAMQTIINNTIYQATLGDIGAQEEAILRNQSATGALRSTGTEQMLAENQRQRRLSALQNAIGGYQGLAGLQSYAPQIAQATSNIGQTLGQGMIGAAQSEQASNQAGMSNLMGLGQLGLAAFSAFCDPSLKDNVEKIGESEGYNIYSWDWNDKAKELGLEGKGYGPMADEIKAREPERITMKNGYMYVNERAA